MQYSRTQYEEAIGPFSYAKSDVKQHLQLSVIASVLMNMLPLNTQATTIQLLLNEPTPLLYLQPCGNNAKMKPANSALGRRVGFLLLGAVSSGHLYRIPPVVGRVQQVVDVPMTT